MLRLVSFTNTVARFTNELDKTNLFVKLKKVLNKSVKKITLIYLFLLKNFCIYMYGTCRTVSWNVIILNNINDNIVKSKQHTRGPRGPWNAHLRVKIFKISLFSLLYIQQATPGGLNLK